MIVSVCLCEHLATSPGAAEGRMVSKTDETCPAAAEDTGEGGERGCDIKREAGELKVTVHESPAGLCVCVCVCNRGN